MSTTYAFFQAKNGQGCTVTACAASRLLPGSTLLVDTQGDCSSALGIPEPDYGNVTHVNMALSIVRINASDFDPSAYDFDNIVVDAGTEQVSADIRYLVTKGCYLALRRAVGRGVSCDGIILVSEVGRALGANDVGRAIGAPVICSIPYAPEISRLVDAGLLANRIPSVFDVLRNEMNPATI